MMKWAIAKVLDRCADMNNDHFHTFVIKRNGVIIGDLKWVRRWKSAGGGAWQARINSDLPGCAGICYTDKNKAKVLEQVKALHAN